MTVNYVTIKGYVKEGKLEVELPENVVDGEAEIKIVVKNAGENHYLPTSGEPSDNLENLPEEANTKFLHPESLTGAEIVAKGLTGGWKDLGIEDSVAWVEEQKRKRRERHKWQQD